MKVVVRVTPVRGIDFMSKKYVAAITFEAHAYLPVASYDRPTEAQMINRVARKCYQAFTDARLDYIFRLEQELLNEIDFHPEQLANIRETFKCFHESLDNYEVELQPPQ